MTKARRDQQQQAVESLRELLKPGDTVHTVLRHVSRSGMSRLIDCYVIVDNEPRWISGLVARATGMTLDKADAIRVGGCGMDMGFHVVYSLSRTLFHSDLGGFVCTGKDCPSNDHNNAYYCECEKQCVVCGNRVADPEYVRYHSEHRSYTVCSEACAKSDWRHSDGGYALKQRWM